MPLIPFQIHDLFVFIIITYTYICIYIHISLYNLTSPFNVVGMYVYFGFNSLELDNLLIWGSYQEKTDSSSPGSWFSVSLYWEAWTCEVSPYIMNLFRQPHQQNIMGAASLWCLEDIMSQQCSSPLVFKISPPLSCGVPWASGLRVVLQMYPLGLGTPCSLILDVCEGFYLLQKESSLMRSGSYTHLCV